MPARFPWGMPPNFMHEGYAPTFAHIPISSLVMSVPPPVVHTLPCIEETIYHFESSEGPDVPDFEKYKGNTCPLSHLVMYAHKMSTQIENDQLFVHYFQDSLTDAALQGYTGLDNASIRTFNDLGEAFVKQYKYNLDMDPDRDQLQSMS
ncbi:hypothetical protein KIW84_012960 [Lathyrus oleraceus]|uniref:Uncharacterized protein n=1 Tax=Pisum sativum TaxID=3888 RepID=A0A9D5BIW5_PEA|nr:hypothetical protein KIW84_012960 [Pisum sativum]